MERKQAAESTEYTFQPTTEWAREADFDTLIVHLPGYRKEELKVQVTSSNKLKISGQRPIGDKGRSSFLLERQIPANCDTNGISAKYEGGKLFIKHPKVITSADHRQERKAQAAPPPEAPKPQTDYADAQKGVKDQTVDHAKAGMNGPADQRSGKVSPPETGDEKQARKEASNGETKTALAEANKTHAAENIENSAAELKSTALEQEKEKDQKVDDAATSSVAACSSNKFRTDDLKQALGGLVMQQKQRRTFMNFLVAILLILVAWSYAKNAIGSIAKSKN